VNERKELLLTYYKSHRRKLNLIILKIAFVYLSLSIIWNSVFQMFDLPYSRADLPILYVCLLVWIGIVLLKRVFQLSSMVMEHGVLLFVVFVVSCLYFGSGYMEAWGFYLLVPLIAGLYGTKIVLVAYSLIGLVLMTFFSVVYPLVPNVYDSIDLSNRILLYMIVATFSHLLLAQLTMLYSNQVNTIIESTRTKIEQVVKTFIIAIEAKDAYTFGHSERVSKYAVELARHLPQFGSDRRLQSLRLSGLLHDIGKINIPESVLSKLSPLTDEEYELIKTHPVVGARMVEKIPGLSSLKAGVLYHHERWDGKGYPTGIKNEQIPIEARILAVADAFDAMTSDRAYRNAMTVNQAFDQLKQGRGTQFDPNLIDLLDDVKMSWMKIHKEEGDDVKEFERLTDLL
jgi:putative nucleotidyltransferase with HDIG domain